MRDPTSAATEIIEEHRYAIEYAHAYIEELPDRPPHPDDSRASRVDQSQAARVIVVEWLAIVAAVILCTRFWNLALYLWSVVFIGARQHGPPSLDGRGGRG